MMKSIEAERRQHIIDCTIAVLVQNGAAGTSLSRIASEANVAKGIICYYFGNKEGLFDAVLASVHERMVEAIVADADAIEEEWQRMSAFIGGHLTYARQNRDQLLALRHLSPTRAGGSEVSDHLAVWREQRAWLVATLTAGQDRGTFKSFDPSVVATAISGALEGGLLHWAHDDTLDLDRYADQLLDLFEPGVCGPPPSEHALQA